MEGTANLNLENLERCGSWVDPGYKYTCLSLPWAWNHGRGETCKYCTEDILMLEQASTTNI